MATGTIISDYANESLSPVTTRSSGSSYVYDCSAVRNGNVVHYNLQLQNSGGSVSAGSNSFSGTVSGLPTPINNVAACAFSASSGIIGVLSLDFTITVRIIASSLAKQTSGYYQLTWTYLTAE